MPTRSSAVTRLAELRAVGVAVAPGGRQLLLVVSAHAPRRGLERGAAAPGCASAPARELGARHLERGDRGGLAARSKRRVYSSTAASPRAFTSASIGRDVGVDLRILRGLEREQLREPRVEVGLRGGEAPDPDHRAARAKASSSGWIAARFNFNAAWLTISRALTGAISSTAFRWFALQRLAGAHQVDDRVGEPGQRRELHRAVELDQIDVHALGGEVLARRLHVLGGDLAAARPAAPRAGSRSPRAPRPSCGSARS